MATMARLISEDSQADEETIQGLLREAPRDIKAQKVNEWINLANKAKNVEWMEEKRIPERIKRYLDDANLAIRSAEVAKFVNDALICATSEDTVLTIGVFDQAVKAYATNQIQGIEHLESLVKDMIDYKMYQNALFEFFDSLQTKVKTVKQDAEAATIIRKSLSSDEAPALGLVKSSDRLSYQQVKDLLQSMQSVPKQIAEEVAPQIEQLRAELNLFTDFLQTVKPDCDTMIKQLADVQSGSQLAEIQSLHSTLTREYSSQFVFRDDDFESLLNKVEVLIKGCIMLQSGLAAIEPMDDELERKQRSQSAPYREIVAWEDLLASVKEACKDLAKQAPIVDEISEPLETAKKFMQVVQNISNGQPTSNNSFIELDDLKIIVLERRQSTEKIKLEESLRYLEEIIEKAEGIEKLLSEEKVELHKLKDALTFMQRVGIQFAHLLDDCVLKIQRAERFLEHFKYLAKDTLEKEFERYTEDYNALNISIPEIEQTFNVVQECRYLRVEADRLLASEDIDLNEALEVKNKLNSVTYFKNPGVIANLLVKIFYKMREVYEQSDEQRTFVIPYPALCKLITEGHKLISGKLSNELKSNLKEKLAMASQIFKDVEAHLNKHVYNQSMKALLENPPAEIFRNFVNISEPIANQIKSFESLEDPYREKPSIPEKPKVELDRLVPREVITHEFRDGFIRSWKEPFLQNKTFGLDHNSVSIYSKQLEREIFNRYQSNPHQYEKTCEEISRVLTEITHYSAISQNIKSKKFGVKAFSEYFGKSLADIRQINFVMAKSPAYLAEVAKQERTDQAATKLLKKIPYGEGEMRILEESHEGMVVGEYQYYRIFVGDISIQFTDVLKLEKVQLLTCNRAKIISNFSSIPPNLTLSSKCSREAFNEYFGGLLQVTPSKVKILAGYLASSGSTDRLQKLHQILIQREVVCSKTYSERFKLFVVPREFLQKEWLEVISIVTMVKDVDLVFFIVYKLPDTGHEIQNDNTIVPEPLPIAGGRAYKLVFNTKVKDHHLSIELLKEPKKIDKLLPEHLRTKIAQTVPTTDPLATSFTQKNPMDLMKSSEEGMSKVIKNYNKTISSLNLQPGTSGGYHSGNHESANFSHSRHEARDSQKEADEPQFSKRYTNPKMDFNQIDPHLDSLGQKKGPSFETDLLGELQNVKPSRQFSKQSGSFGHGGQPNYGIPSKVIDPISTTTDYSELPSYTPAQLSFQTDNFPKMISKRPPIVHSSPNILSSLGQSSLGMHSVVGSSQLEAHVQPQSSERKSFLHQAISAIQIPPTGAAGMQHLQPPESKIHQALSKKNLGSAAYNVKSLARPSEGRHNLNSASLELVNNYQIDPPMSKKKHTYPTPGGLQGTGHAQGYNPNQFDHIKNQFF